MGLYQSHQPLAIFDLDGTLCDLTHRLHFIRGKRPDWNGFFDACGGDAPVPNLLFLNSFLWNAGWHVWIFSGRSDRARPQTEEWLLRYGARYDVLEMRRDGDYTPDHELKESWLLSMLDVDRERLRFVVDDRKRVVEMWRSHGVTCLQCAEGEF